MGKGPKGGIGYAEEGEQDQNYLTQLVLKTWGRTAWKIIIFRLIVSRSDLFPKMQGKMTVKMAANVQSRREHVQAQACTATNTSHWNNKETKKLVWIKGPQTVMRT